MEAFKLDEETLRAWVREEGFPAVGFCSASGFPEIRREVEQQEPIRERRQLRYEPEADDPRVRSLAVLLAPYVPAAPESRENAFVDSYYYASNAAYHAAARLEKRILAAGGYAKANVSYPAKEAALRAGLGTVLKNGLLLHPQYGTRAVIILMALDMEYTGQDREYGGMDPRCRDCTRCERACPGCAITSGGMTAPQNCVRNYMMEGIVCPEEYRGKMGMRLLGCDICQRACPLQPEFPGEKRAGYPLDGFLTEDPAKFSESVKTLAEEIGRNAARPQRVRAQAAILAGNRGDPEDIPVLEAWSGSEFEPVRVHARWAIERIMKKQNGRNSEAVSAENKREEEKPC